MLLPGGKSLVALHLLSTSAGCRRGSSTQVSRTRHLRPNPPKPPCRNEGFLKEKTNEPTNWETHHFRRKTGTFAVPSATNVANVTARGGRRNPAARPVPLPGSTSLSRGKPSGRGWASLGKRTKKGTGRDCSGHPRRAGRLQGRVPRAQQHPPAVTQGRRRKPGRHGRPGAWEARAHASIPTHPSPLPTAEGPASRDTPLRGQGTHAPAPTARALPGLPGNGKVGGGLRGWGL